GRPPTISDLRLEALMLSLVAERQSRSRAAELCGWLCDDWPPFRDNVLRECVSNIIRIHEATESLVFPCIGLCLARLQRYCSGEQIEMLALLPSGEIDIEAIKKDEIWAHVLGYIATTGPPAASEFAGYNRETKLKILQAVSSWLVEMYGPGEDIYGRY